MKPPLNKIDIKSSDSNVYFTILDETNTAKNVNTKRKVTTDLQRLLQSQNLPKLANS